MKKISVIVPFYHGNKYIKNLARIIEENNNNLKKNDDNSELEWIIVKDSLDDEIELDINNYDVTIKIIKNKENVGVHKSRINGLKESNGDYVLFLDQDDLVSENYCLSQLQKIGDNDVIIANGYLYWKDTQEKKVLYHSKKQQEKCFDLEYCGNIFTVVSPGLYIVKRSVIPTDWIEKPLNYTGCDDAYLWLLLIVNNAKFAVNEEKIYTHIITGNNATNNTTSMCKSILEFTDRMEGKIPKKYIRRKIRYAKYYLKPNRSFLSKLLYLDNILLRRYYFRKFNKE